MTMVVSPPLASQKSAPKASKAPVPAPSRRAVWLASLGVVALVGAVAFFANRSFASPPQTITVVRRDLRETVEASGVAESVRKLALRARASGTVASLDTRENQRVPQGTSLLALDVNAASLALAQARSNAEANSRQAQTQLAASRRSLAEAESRQAVTLVTLEQQVAKALTAAAFLDRDLSRFQALAAEGAVSRQMLEQQEQQGRQAHSDLQLARSNLSRARTATEVVVARNAVAQALTSVANAASVGRAAVAVAAKTVAEMQVKAPFPGTVTDWLVGVGDQVTPGTPLGTFQDLETLQMRLPLDELDVPKVRFGLPVELVFDTYPGRVYRGAITQLSQASVEGVGNVRVFPVEVRFENAGRRIGPGMSGDATVIVRHLAKVLVIPLGAVSRAGQGYTVSVLDAHDQPRVTPITTGVMTLDQVEVTSGLREGDRVVYAVVKAK